ncbi:IS3 family transposase, partial [Xenorhabdus sp. XENO-10]|nr:IS3 family transposase [Xenorhabdus yunnanensis]
ENGEGDLKEGERLLCERTAVRCWFIKEHAEQFPICQLCRVMKVSRSTFYAWQAKPVRLLSDEQQALHRKATALF